MVLKSNAVIICTGRASNGVDLRSVSLDLPWALFPLETGRVCELYSNACIEQIPGLEAIYFVGMCEERMFEEVCTNTLRKCPNVRVEYIMCESPQGTATWLINIIEKVKYNCDFLYFMDVSHFTSLPLKELAECHHKNNAQITVLCTTPATGTTGLHIKENSNEVTEVFESSAENTGGHVSCAVYTIGSSVFECLKKLHDDILHATSNMGSLKYTPYINFDKHLLPKLAQQNKLHCYKNIGKDFLVSVRTLGDLLPAITTYLNYKSPQKNIQQFPTLYPGCTIIPPVSISPRVVIGKNTSIGPNVIIGDNVNIGDGVRIKNSAILDNVIIENGSCIINSVIFSKVYIGPWARIEGSMGTDHCTRMFIDKKTKKKFVSVIGKNVSVSSGKVVYDSIIFPGVYIEENEHYEIIF